jgi:hypothetical protein
MTGDKATWAERNRRVVFAEIAAVQCVLSGSPAADDELAAARAALGGPSSIDALASAFTLSAFERAVVITCAGIDLSSEMADACAAGGGLPFPTFRLLLAKLHAAHFSATTVHAPLRAYRLVESRPGEDLMSARLRLDERVLHYVLGVPCLDASLRGIIVTLEREPGGVLPRAYERGVERLTSAWTRRERRPLVQLCGADAAGKLLVAAEACARVDVVLSRVRAADLPLAPLDRDQLVRTWEREARLVPRVLFIELDDSDPPEAIRATASFVERLNAVALIATRNPIQLPHLTTTRVDVEPLGAEDQRLVWKHELQLSDEVVETQLGAVMGQFRLGLGNLQTAAAEIRDELAAGDTATLGRLAWRACRRQARPRLDDLAQRIDATASWNDLVLPAPKLRLLHDIAAHVRNTGTVYDRWGFGTRGARGLGITALFAGASGTGKTMAAEVLAGELELDLYKVDLSQIVSKYIGETEKNLRRIFDAAEECGALLLFDEADSLFGKRSEVKDSHDRYANLEVSYLLQRMEQYRGLAVLTTNMRRSLDHAFLRRLRFVVEFPFPDATQRIEIWKRAFPPPTPTATIDHGQLARLNISGGVIRSIALNAAFLAADAGEPIGMHHLQHAVREEYLKLEKPYDGVL